MVKPMLINFKSFGPEGKNESFANVFRSNRKASVTKQLLFD